MEKLIALSNHLLHILYNINFTFEPTSTLTSYAPQHKFHNRQHYYMLHSISKETIMPYNITNDIKWYLLVVGKVFRITLQLSYETRMNNHPINLSHTLWMNTHPLFTDYLDSQYQIIVGYSWSFLRPI